MALMGVASGSYVGGASGASWVHSRGGARASPHHLAMQVKSAELGVAAKAAATVVEEVSRSVKSKGVEAPDAVASFVSMDEDRRGLVDDEGLPLIYDKGAIQKYWDGQGGALQQRWGEFLAVSVPFITRTAALLISGGTDALEKNAAELARDARVGIEKLGPTYVKMGQMLSVRPDVLPQATPPLPHPTPPYPTLPHRTPPLPHPTPPLPHPTPPYPTLPHPTPPRRRSTS